VLILDFLDSVDDAVFCRRIAGRCVVLGARSTWEYLIGMGGMDGGSFIVRFGGGVSSCGELSALSALTPDGDAEGDPTVPEASEGATSVEAAEILLGPLFIALVEV
jgi:hypothetical protein